MPSKQQKTCFMLSQSQKALNTMLKKQGSVNVGCKIGLMWIATGIHFEFCRDGLGITTGSLHRQREDNSRAHQINRCQQNHSQIIRKQSRIRCKQSLWHWLEFAKVPRWTLVSIEGNFRGSFWHERRSELLMERYSPFSKINYIIVSNFHEKFK